MRISGKSIILLYLGLAAVWLWPAGVSAQPGPRARQVGLGAPQPAATPKVSSAANATPKPRLVLQQGHEIFNNGFAVFSADGRLLATGAGSSVIVWDVATGREVRRLEGNSEPEGYQDISWMWGAFSPDGGKFAVGNGDNLRLWDLRTGKLLWFNATASDYGAYFPAAKGTAPLFFSPDGKQIIVARTGKKVDVATGRAARGPVLIKDGENLPITVDKFLSPDGKLLLAKQENGSLTITEKGHALQTLAVPAQEPNLWEKYEGDLAAFALTPDNRTAVTVTNYNGGELTDRQPPAVLLWDVAQGAVSQKVTGRSRNSEASFTFTPAGELLEVIKRDGGTFLRDFISGRIVALNGLAQPLVDYKISPDGRFVATISGPVAQVWNAGTGAQVARVEAASANFKKSPKAPDNWDNLFFTPEQTVTFIPNNDGFKTVINLTTGETEKIVYFTWASMPLEDTDTGAPVYIMSLDGQVAAWETRGDDKPRLNVLGVEQSEPKSFPIDLDEAYGDESDIILSPDGKRALIATANAGGNMPQNSVKVWNLATGRAQFKLLKPGFRVGKLAWSPDGKTLATGADDGTVKLWDAATGRALRNLSVYANGVGSIKFAPDSQRVMVENGDGFTRLFEVATGREICRFLPYPNGDWVVIDPAGRFDTNNLNDIQGLHWIAPNDPFKPLPLELFMREYYEPRLLERLLAGEKMRPVRDVSQLNLTQPEVAINDVTLAPDAAEAIVNVTVKQPAGDAYDLRLLRDGQLVGYAPANDGKIELNNSAAQLTFRVKLPRTGQKQVEFSAYAFNSDRIKSATARRVFTLPDNLTPQKGRVYLVAVGVNAYENEGLNLRFAANDARQVRSSLAEKFQGRESLGEVVTVQLVSDYTVKLPDGSAVPAQDVTAQQLREYPKTVTENRACKNYLQAVLDKLAGRTADAAALADIPNADKLQAARPEDLVLVSFSGHGYASPDGTFYLITSDTGRAPLLSAEFLRQVVSSDELSRWLRDVDAGELVLIVDACHSAAAVAGTDFKPGPMGSRGLGQLSYDKGMRVLTATQTDNVALEDAALKQGLLSYALVQEGLQKAQADFLPHDGKLFLNEWLAYGVERVPRLYADVREGRMTKQLGLSASEVKTKELVTQKPSLFDFAPRNRATLLAGQ